MTMGVDFILKVYASVCVVEEGVGIWPKFFFLNVWKAMAIRRWNEKAIRGRVSAGTTIYAERQHHETVGGEQENFGLCKPTTWQETILPVSSKLEQVTCDYVCLNLLPYSVITVTMHKNI